MKLVFSNFFKSRAYTSTRNTLTLIMVAMIIILLNSFYEHVSSVVFSMKKAMLVNEKSIQWDLTSKWCLVFNIHGQVVDRLLEK